MSGHTLSCNVINVLTNTIFLPLCSAALVRVTQMYQDTEVIYTEFGGFVSYRSKYKGIILVQ